MVFTQVVNQGRERMRLMAVINSEIANLDKQTNRSMLNV